jgi:hypothetical protein
MHLSGHSREREDALDAALASVSNKLSAKGVLADGRLGLAEEDYQVMLLLRVRPNE